MRLHNRVLDNRRLRLDLLGMNLLHGNRLFNLDLLLNRFGLFRLLDLRRFLVLNGLRLSGLFLGARLFLCARHWRRRTHRRFDGAADRCCGGRRARNIR